MICIYDMIFKAKSFLPQTFHLKRTDLRELCLAAVEMTFLSQEEKDRLRQTIHKDLDKLTHIESV